MRFDRRFTLLQFLFKIHFTLRKHYFSVIIYLTFDKFEVTSDNSEKRRLKNGDLHSSSDGVIDGDTIEVNFDTRIRLDNIDTSEMGTIGGAAATSYLRSLIENQSVKIVERGTGLYGRTLAHVWRISDNLPVNESIVAAGHSNWINN